MGLGLLSWRLERQKIIKLLTKGFQYVIMWKECEKRMKKMNDISTSKKPVDFEEWLYGDKYDKHSTK